MKSEKNKDSFRINIFTNDEKPKMSPEAAKAFLQREKKIQERLVKKLGERYVSKT
ncbi:hypothetical protein [Heliorestis acidaminivorans]|uniref:hypothetical protein n=1 Tax=Heliorestis acidaminivorans TaxID=553427 RepID=UPI00147939C5|nr:hypothetical protein [Heliorestis acidaminivorans]